MPGQIRYTSQLPAEHLSALQELMFFNEKQPQYRAGIVASIEQFGEPVVRSEGGFLRIHTTRLGEVQTLFALEEDEEASRPIGVAVYARSAEDAITVLHIGVDKDFASDGLHADQMVAVNLFQRLIEVGRKIKGIRKAIVLYGPTEYTEIPIRR